MGQKLTARPRAVLDRCTFNCGSCRASADTEGRPNIKVQFSHLPAERLVEHGSQSDARAALLANKNRLRWMPDRGGTLGGLKGRSLVEASAGRTEGWWRKPAGGASEVAAFGRRDASERRLRRGQAVPGCRPRGGGH
jgi:hypothetical protein